MPEMRTKDGAASPLLLADRALATLPLSPDCRRRETRAEFDRGLEGMRSQGSYDYHYTRIRFERNEMESDFCIG